MHSLPSNQLCESSLYVYQKRRRYDPWKRNESVNLVREYLSCVDELTTIKLTLQKKMDLFQALLLDAKKFEIEDLQGQKEPNSPDGESSQERVLWAMGMVKSQLDCFERLLIDTKQSMNAVCYPLFLLAISFVLNRNAQSSTALSTPFHRAERTCHCLGLPEQGNSGLHRRNYRLLAAVLLYVLLRNESGRHC